MTEARAEVWPRDDSDLTKDGYSQDNKQVARHWRGGNGGASVGAQGDEPKGVDTGPRSEILDRRY